MYFTQANPSSLSRFGLLTDAAVTKIGCHNLKINRALTYVLLYRLGILRIDIDPKLALNVGFAKEKSAFNLMQTRPLYEKTKVLTETRPTGANNTLVQQIAKLLKNENIEELVKL